MNAGPNNHNYIDNKKRKEKEKIFFDTNEEIDYIELITKNQNLKLENQSLKNKLEKEEVQFNLNQATNEQKLQNLENENKLALKRYNEEITKEKELLIQDFQKQLKDLNTKHELKIKNLEKTIAEKEKTIAYQNNEISSFQSQINKLKQSKKNLGAQINNLQTLNAELKKYKQLYKEIAGNNIESFTENQRKNINTFQREFVKLIVLTYYAELIQKNTSEKIINPFTNPFEKKIPRKNIIKKHEEDTSEIKNNKNSHNKVWNFLETRFNEIKKVFNLAKEPISKKITSESEKIKKTANNYYKKIKEKEGVNKCNPG